MPVMPTYTELSPSLAPAIAGRPKPTHDTLAAVFNQCFGETYQVRCIGGFVEPEYLPVQLPDGLAELRYTQDYPASALHEIAHWCIAGEGRLARADFGYGYLAPPRDSATQQRFFALELKVQTLEAWFALGTGVRFVASADNFECSDAALKSFAQQISERLQNLTQEGLPQRAQQFADALRIAGLGVWPSAGQLHVQYPREAADQDKVQANA